eukprot:6492471-Amphidinium_carterae.2
MGAIWDFGKFGRLRSGFAIKQHPAIRNGFKPLLLSRISDSFASEVPSTKSLTIGKGVQDRRKRGRPAREEKQHLKKRGGGGAWRAFIHCESQKQEGGVDFKVMRDKYVSLTPEEKEWYIELGRAATDLKREHGVNKPFVATARQAWKRASKAEDMPASALSLPFLGKKSTGLA